MSSVVRRTTAVAGASLAILFSLPVAAQASGNYPPSTPSPTVSGVKVTTPSSVASTPDVVDTVATNPSNSALPRTGTDVAAWTLGGGALVLAGTAMIVVTRRRAQHS